MNLHPLQLVMVVLLPYITSHLVTGIAVELRQTSQAAAEIPYHAGSRGGQGPGHASALRVDRNILAENASEISRELSCDNTCREAQRDALNQLFLAWNGPSWNRSANWTRPNVSVCHWEGVWCCVPAGVDAYDPVTSSSSNAYACPDNNEVVVGLSLQSNNMSGAVAAVPWSSLSRSLKHLHLDENRLTGGLTTFAPLCHLQHLSLTANLLTGTLQPLAPDPTPPDPDPAAPVPSPGDSQPSAAVPMAQLASLVLAGNQLSGTLPTGLLRHPTLQYLDLSRNALSGPLPTAPGSRIATLRLAGNSRLTGPLPPGLTRLTSLDVLGTALQADQPGTAGLPSYLALSNSTYMTDRPGPSGALCPLAILQPSGQSVSVAPYYWQYDSCICQAGYAASYTHTTATPTISSESTLADSDANTSSNSSDIAGSSTTSTAASSSTTTSGSSQGPVVAMACVADNQRAGGSVGSFPWWVALLATAGGLALAVVLLRLARRLAPSVERYRAAMARRMPPGFGRRAAGCQVTLVLTDVEGSTELWEWDTDVMATAIELHDHTLRSSLPKWQGYEVQTEGDAFLVAFHEPADALGWCISTQLLLLNADWDPELFKHPKAGIETSDSLLPQLHSNPLLAFTSFRCNDPTAQLITPQTQLPLPLRPLGQSVPNTLPQYLHPPPSHTHPQSHHPHHPPQSAPLVKLSGGPMPAVRPTRPLTQLGGQRVGGPPSGGAGSPASGPGLLVSHPTTNSFTQHTTTEIMLGGGSGGDSGRGGAGDGGLSLALGLELGPGDSGGSSSEAPEDHGGGGRRALDRLVPYRGRASTAAALTLQSGEPHTLAAAAAAASIRGGPAGPLATTHSGAFASAVSGEVGGLMVGQSGISFMVPCRTGHMMSLDTRPAIGTGGGGCSTLQDILQGTATHGSASHDWCRFTRLGVQYRGLRVRMGVATGAADALRPHAVTQKVEYYGEVRRRVQAVADLPHGGQILIDAATFNATHNNLTDLSTRLLQVLTRASKNTRSFRVRSSPVHTPERSPHISYTHHSQNFSHAHGAGATGLTFHGLTIHGTPTGKGPMAGLMRLASLARPATTLELSRGHPRRPSRHPLDLATAPEPPEGVEEQGRHRMGSSVGFFDRGEAAGGQETWWDGGVSVAAVGQRLLSAWRLVRPPSMRTMSVGHGTGGGGGAAAAATIPTSRPTSAAHRSALPLLDTTSASLPQQAPVFPSAVPLSVPTGQQQQQQQQQRSQRPTPASGPSRQQLISSSPLLPSSLLPPIIQNVVSEPPPPPPFLQQQPSQLDGSAPPQPQQLLSRTTSLPSHQRLVPRRMLGGFSTVDSGAVTASTALFGSAVEVSSAAPQSAAVYGTALSTAYGSSIGGGADSTEIGDGSIGAGVTSRALASGGGSVGPVAESGGGGGGTGPVQGCASAVQPIATPPTIGNISFDGYSSGRDHTAASHQQQHQHHYSHHSNHHQHHHHHHHHHYNSSAHHHRHPHPQHLHQYPRDSQLPATSPQQVQAYTRVGSGAGMNTGPVGGGTSFSEQDTLPLTFVPEEQLTRHGSREPQSAPPASGCVTPYHPGEPAAASPHGGLTPLGAHTPLGGLPLPATISTHRQLREAHHTHTGRRGSAAAAVGIMAMGVFELHAGNSVEYISLTQVLVPGLEERARLSPPMGGSRQLTPGYLDAPAATAAPLGLRAPRQLPLPTVAVVFCSLERYPEMVAVSRDLSFDVLAVYNDVVRRSLLACGGYECQEQEGHFMVAFGRPGEALEWCLMLQELVMEVAWTPPMLCLPGMQEQRHALTGAVLFRGPRVKAGLYGGVPTRVGPHPTTGRADYYGPLVNRAARFCHAAAQGGQVILARYLVEDILREDLHLVTPVTANGSGTTATATTTTATGTVNTTTATTSNTTTATTSNTTTATTTPTTPTPWHPATGPPPGSSLGFGPSTSSGSGKVGELHTTILPPGAAMGAMLRRSADLGGGGGGGGVLEGGGGGGGGLHRPHYVPPESLPLRLVAAVDNIGVAHSRWRMPADAAASSTGGGGGAGGGGGGSSQAVPPSDHDDNGGDVVLMTDPNTVPLGTSRTHMLTSHTGSSRKRTTLWQQAQRPSACGNCITSSLPLSQQLGALTSGGGAGSSGLPVAACSTGAAAAANAAAAASLELVLRGSRHHHHRTRGALPAAAAATWGGGGLQRPRQGQRPQSCSGVGPQGGSERTPRSNACGGNSGSSSGVGGGGMSIAVGSDLKRTGSQPLLNMHTVASTAAVGGAGGSVVVQGVAKSSSNLAVPSVSSVCTGAPSLMRRSGGSHYSNPFVASPAVAGRWVTAVGTAFEEEEVPPTEVVVVYDIPPSIVPPIMRPLLEAAIAAVASASPRPTGRGYGASGATSGGDCTSAARGDGGGDHSYVSRRPQMLLQQQQQPSTSSSVKHHSFNPPTPPYLLPSPLNAASLSRQSQVLRLLLSAGSGAAGVGSTHVPGASLAVLPTIRPSGRSNHGALRRCSTVLYDSVPHSLPKLPDSCIRQRTGAFRWLWARELLVEDLGSFRFKGVAGAHHLVSVSTAATSERRAGPRVHTAKGERVEPGRGPLYRVVLQAAQPSVNNDLARVQATAKWAREGAAAAASNGAGGGMGAAAGGGFAGGGLSPIPGSGTTRGGEPVTEDASSEWPAPSPPPTSGRT